MTLYPTPLFYPHHPPHLDNTPRQNAKVFGLCISPHLVCVSIPIKTVKISPGPITPFYQNRMSCDPTPCRIYTKLATICTTTKHKLKFAAQSMPACCGGAALSLFGVVVAVNTPVRLSVVPVACPCPVVVLDGGCVVANGQSSDLL